MRGADHGLAGDRRRPNLRGAERWSGGRAGDAGGAGSGHTRPERRNLAPRRSRGSDLSEGKITTLLLLILFFTKGGRFAMGVLGRFAIGWGGLQLLRGL